MNMFTSFSTTFIDSLVTGKVAYFDTKNNCVVEAAEGKNSCFCYFGCFYLYSFIVYTKHNLFSYTNNSALNICLIYMYIFI